MNIPQSPLVTQLIAWHNLDWRDTAIKAFWPLLSVQDRQAYLYYTERWLIHPNLLTDLRWANWGA